MDYPPPLRDLHWTPIGLSWVYMYVHTYITLHYITLHYTTLHCIALHYITLHYITFIYIHIAYIYIYNSVSHIMYTVCAPPPNWRLPVDPSLTCDILRFPVEIGVPDPPGFPRLQHFSAVAPKPSSRESPGFLRSRRSRFVRVQGSGGAHRVHLRWSVLLHLRSLVYSVASPCGSTRVHLFWGSPWLSHNGPHGRATVWFPPCFGGSSLMKCSRLDDMSPP